MNDAATATTMLPPRHGVTKRCGCGRVHDTTDWNTLSNPRIWKLEDEWLELRECACGSTLAIEVE